MNVNIEDVDFSAKADLKDFINKKIAKLEQYSDKITTADVHMRVIKPETKLNKEVVLKVAVPNASLVVTKTADSFEEAFDNCMDAMIRQIEKSKDKNK